MQRLITLGLESLQSERLTTNKSLSIITFDPNNTRFRTALEPPEDDDVIRFTKLKPLGREAKCIRWLICIPALTTLARLLQ
jgi:hypothetical protein